MVKKILFSWFLENHQTVFQYLIYSKIEHVDIFIFCQNHELTLSLVKSNFANISNLYFYSLKSFVFYLEDDQKHLNYLTYSKIENVDCCKKEFCPKLRINPFEKFKLCKYIRSIFSYCKKPCFLSRIPLY